MRHWFRMAIVIVAIVTHAVVSLHTDDSQSPQKPAAVQGWAGTPPGPEAPLEPKPPATVKEGEVWIPPLPAMEVGRAAGRLGDERT